MLRCSQFSSSLSDDSPRSQITLQALRTFSGLSDRSPGSQVALRSLRSLSKRSDALKSLCGLSDCSPGSQIALQAFRSLSVESAQIDLRALASLSGLYHSACSQGSQIALRAVTSLLGLSGLSDRSRDSFPNAQMLRGRSPAFQMILQTLRSPRSSQIAL